MNRLGGITLVLSALGTAGCAQDNYLNDRLTWDKSVTVYGTNSSNGGVDLATSYCLPAGTSVVGLNTSLTLVTQSDPNASSGASVITSMRSDDPRLQRLLAVRLVRGDSKTCDAAKTLYSDQQLYVRKEDLETAHRRFTIFTF